MLNKKIGIDLGTSNCVMYIENEGIIFNEPTVVALSVDDNSIIAVGQKAREMIGKTPDNIVACKPVKNGVIANYKVAEALLRYAIRKVSGKSRFWRPDVVINIPVGATSVEERAIQEVINGTGAKETYLIRSPLLAAIGCNLPIDTSSGNMVINIGGGTCEVAVMSLNGIVVTSSVRIGGETMNDTIATYLRRKYGIIVGEQMLEEVKLSIGDCLLSQNPKSMDVKGRDFASGLPKIVEVNSTDIVEAVKPNLTNIVLCIKSVLEKTPPELTSDIVDRGVALTGGTAQFNNLDLFLSRALNVPVYVVDQPFFSVAKGAGEALMHLDVIKRAQKS